jgi:hypothetical protein
MGGILASTIGVQHAIVIGSTISFASILWLAVFGGSRDSRRMQMAG